MHRSPGNVSCHGKRVVAPKRCPSARPRLLRAGALSLSLALAGLPAQSADDASAVPAQEWPSAARDTANTRYAPLTDIDAHNAARLKEVFRFSTGVQRGHEAAPIVGGGMMFVVTPFPNVVYGFALVPGSVAPRWTYAPEPARASQGVACCDVVNRGAAYADGRVFFNTLDGQTIALDAASGRQLWRTQLGDISRGETITMAPLVVKDRVLVGNSGGELGVRGWIAALDAASGRTLWRAYSTGPDADVLIGPAFRPFYASDRGKDLGVRSWPPDAWRIGGGTVWGFLSYDPELDLVYHGTANPGPWNPEQRPGDNKWTAGIFARRPSTGEAIWFYQWSPHDLHDYDGVNENVLVDLAIGGRVRKVLLHADRNGYLYVVDRASGEVLSADAFTYINTTRGVDLDSGRLRYDPTKEPSVGKTVRDICPASPGGKDWQPSAWSPRTQRLYLPQQNLCQDAMTSTVSHIPGTPFVGADLTIKPGPGGYRGEFAAWDPVARRKAWSIRERFPVWSGALVTAGDVAFYGTMDGWFKAVDARSGVPLWQFQCGSGVIGQPVSYRGVDGKQYVAVLSGVGGWPGAIVAGDLDARDPTAGGGFANAMRDLPAASPKGGTLHVFALP